MAGKTKSLEKIPGKTPEASPPSRTPAPSVSSSGFSLAAIQRAAGNMAMQCAAREEGGKDTPVRSESALNFLYVSARRAGVQAKHRISSADDPLEEEADRIADAVVQRKEACPCGGTCEDCRLRASQAVLQRKIDGGASHQTEASPAGVGYMGSGQRLDPTTQRFFESQLGHDLSGTRIHTDEAAADSAASINARAFTRGNDIAFARGEYAPGTTEGRRLLAHELAHVTQQRRANPAPIIQRQPRKKKEEKKKQEPIVWREGMLARLKFDFYSEYKAGEIVELDSNPSDWGKGLIQVTFVLAELPGIREKGTSPRWIDVQQLEPVSPDQVPRKDPVVSVPPIWVGPSPPTGISPPAMAGQTGPIIYVVIGAETETSGFGASGLVPGFTTGMGRGLGFLESPPIRGSLTPRFGQTFMTALEPNWCRARSPLDPLGSFAGGTRLERYVGTNVLEHMMPRYYGREGQMLAELEYFRRSTPGYLPPEFGDVARWSDVFDIRHGQLGQAGDLLSRAAREGLDALSDADRALLIAMVGAHAQGGQVVASPFVSGTTRSGVSLIEGIPPTITDRPYIVQIEMPPGAPVGDVNTLLGDQRLASLAPEVEQVFDPRTGANIRVIRVNPSSALGSVMRVARPVGRVLGPLGWGYSGYRIATAEPEELPRVIGEEAGGQAGGYLGAAGGATFCIVAGIATGGWVLLGCALVGGVGGGLAGGYLGGEAGEAIGRSGAMQTLNKIVTPIIERQIWGDKPIPPIGYDPSARARDDPFDYP